MHAITKRVSSILSLVWFRLRFSLVNSLLSFSQVFIRHREEHLRYIDDVQLNYVIYF